MIGTALQSHAETVEHRFVLQLDRVATKVAVAGTFNAWNQLANPMKLGADGRTWTADLRIPLGRHFYKFVIDGREWLADPLAKSDIDLGGNLNSVFVAKPADYSVPASPRDGRITRSALLHDSVCPWVNYDRGLMRFLLRGRPDDFAKAVLVVNGNRVVLHEVCRDDLFARYEAEIPWKMDRDLRYHFELQDGGKGWRYGADGLSERHATPFEVKAKGFKPFVVPGWVEQSVVYQIFPDRFANGNAGNDPANVVKWGSKPSYNTYFGGDAVGVDQHIPYLRDLGVGAVYFTPVFKSPSVHRYDAEDYKTIDPVFGTNAEFDRLTSDLHHAGIRTVMDFAFNHTSVTFPPFMDIREKGQASKYTNWYTIKSYPVVVKTDPPYWAWQNFPSLPKLRVTNPETREYLLGVVDFWKQAAHVDGLRLDVANEVDPSLWKALRKRVKREDPQTWIVGEEWGNASPWLTGDQWDSSMGYEFRAASLQFFVQNSTRASGYVNQLSSIYSSYPSQVSRNLMNLLSSHDVPRFLTLCNGNENLQRLAALVQFTWPGTPSIYYGEEIGMLGGQDPDNRRCMDWSRVTSGNAMLSYYKKLIATRNSSRALQSGDVVRLEEDDTNNTFAFARYFERDVAITVVNNSDSEQRITVSVPRVLAGRVTPESSLIDAFSGNSYKLSQGSISLTVPARKGTLLIKARRGTKSSSIAVRGHDPLLSQKYK